MSTMSAPTWAYRPRPEPDEGLAGYLLRIAQWYGWSGLTDLSRDLTGQALSASGLRGISEHDVLSTVLAQGVAIPAKELSDHWARLRSDQHCFEPGRIVTDIEIGPPRVCPNCLAGGGHLRFEWQVAHVVRCERHSRDLLGVCPACENTLTWSSDLFDGCPHCHEPWRALAAVDERTDALPQPSADTLDRLYRAYLSTAYPPALEVWPRQCLPYAPRLHNAIMRSAYAAVYSTSSNSTLLREATAGLEVLGPLAKATKRHVEDRVTGLRSRQSRTGPWVDILDCACAGERVALPQKIRRTQSPGVNAAHTVTAATCAVVLGIDPPTLHALVDAGVISATAPTRIIRDRLFNLGAVGERIDTLLAKQAPALADDYLTMDEATRLARLFCQGTADIVVWCAEGRLSFSWESADCPFHGLRLPKGELLHVAKDALKTTTRTAFTRAEVLALLNIPESGLDAIARVGLLPSKKWSAPGASFERDRVIRFIEDYRIARREAVISETDVRSAWRAILAEGCEPVLARIGRKHLIGVARGSMGTTTAVNAVASTS